MEYSEGDKKHVPPKKKRKEMPTRQDLPRMWAKQYFFLAFIYTKFENKIAKSMTENFEKFV